MIKNVFLQNCPSDAAWAIAASHRRETGEKLNLHLMSAGY